MNKEELLRLLAALRQREQQMAMQIAALHEDQLRLQGGILVVEQILATPEPKDANGGEPERLPGDGN